jgi:ribosomal protein S18 acetylase RimI-like enzyme
VAHGLEAQGLRHFLRLGTKLVDMLIEFAREKGIDTVYGTVMSENIKMIQLCEKLGFSTRREHENVMAELKLS